MTIRTLKKIDVAAGHFLIFTLRPLAEILGRILGRDHRLRVERQLVVLKMLGGGSLIVAMPALLALRREHPGAQMTLVCTNGVKSFAELMHVFDKILVIDTASLYGLGSSVLRALRGAFRADAIVDLEVHSKLSTVFCLLTCAQNRIGFFMEANRWRLGLGTHFLFLNISSLIATSYNQLATLFGCEVDVPAAVAWFRAKNGLGRRPLSYRFDQVVALAPFCSELGRERELTPEAWAKVLGARADLERTTIVLLGDAARARDGLKFDRMLCEGVGAGEVVNLVGKTRLFEVVSLLASVDELVTIDSGINHLARLCGCKVTSYWGPTAPATRLLLIPGLDEVTHYRKIFCSPCVHVIDEPPCRGDNVCMKQHAGAVDIATFEARGWSIDRETPLL